MNVHPWTRPLVAAGVVSLAGLTQGEEAQHPVLTALSSTSLSGYVSTSAIWKFGTGNTLAGRSYDGTGKQDGFNLDVVKLSLAKPFSEAEWSAGYNVDLLMGPDAATFNTMTAGPIAGPSNLAIEQANVVLRAPLGNGLSFTFGVFDTPYGYEVTDATRNPNFSRSYGYAIIPRQHTGVVAAYPITDWLIAAAGVANTCNSAINGRAFRPGGPAAESEKTYVGALYLTAPDSFGFAKGAALKMVIGNGMNGAGNAIPAHATAFYAGGTLPTPVKGLSIGAAYDYVGWQQNGVYSSFYANATSIYLLYQATEKLKLNNRLEYASGTSGTWTGGLVPPAVPMARVKPPGGEEFFAETFTVDYALWANVISRAEFRWDHDLTARRGVAAPFGGGAFDGDKNALSLALNLIYKF